jgi:hypothetical protein
VTGSDRDEQWKHRHPAWEPVDASRVADARIRTSRLPVPGGWIYKVTERDDECFGVGVCFVPDH